MRAQALVARNLRRLRVKRNLSQEALAADAGIDRTYVSRFERGLENPTVALLEQLSDALSATIVEFFVVPARRANQAAEGLTEERLADLSGFSQQNISRLDQGGRNPTVVSLYELATALGVSHIELMRSAEDE